MMINIKLLTFFTFLHVTADRLGPNKINLEKLNEEWEKEDLIEFADLPLEDPRKQTDDLNLKNFESEDHLATVAESKKGQSYGLYVQTIADMTEDEREKLYDIWQLNMINCCGFELMFAPIESGQVLVQIPDAKFLVDFGRMLQKDPKCHTFIIDHFHMLCAGHPNWNANKPGQYVGNDGIKAEL